MLLLKSTSSSLLFLFTTTVSALSSALSSTLQHIPTFGPNPRNVSMYIYVPSNISSSAKPPILVVPHWCHGTAQAAFDGRPYATLGDTYGFISIYPNSSNTADQCWDVSSSESLTHEGGGDALSIVSMVRWAIEELGADKDRVFVTGTSSGAMMTNVLLGSYPDVFAAGSAWAGVAFGCFAAGAGQYDIWSDACATGKIIRNGSEWADIVHAAYPSYPKDAFRPKMQVLHGLNDTTLYPQNLREEVKQWTAVFGYDVKVYNETRDTPLKGWTRYSYGEKFEAYTAEGVTHDIPNQADTVMDWFDLRCKGEGCYSRRTR